MDQTNHFVLSEVQDMGSLSHTVVSPGSLSHMNNITVYSSEPDTIIMEEDEIIKSEKANADADISATMNYSRDLNRLETHAMDGMTQTSLAQPGFIAMKPQTVNDVLLDNATVQQVLFNDGAGNEMIVPHNVEVRVPSDNPHGEIILVPNSMIKQEDIIEGGEVVVGSSVSNEIVIGEQNTGCRFNNERFTVADVSSDSGDDGGFEDSKLVIDTSCINMEDSNVEVGFDCTECGSVLKSKASLKRHIKNCHSKEKQSYKKNSKKKKESGMRPEGAPMNKVYTCPSCSYATKRRDKLDKHIQNHVLLEGYHPCGKRRKSRIDVPPRRHRHNAEEYKCHLCPYSCTVYKALKKHRKLHSSGHSFTLKISCKICGKDRPTEAESQKHMQKHRNGEYFMCDLCNFSSIQLKKIIQHRRMHTGEKPHLCPHCNYRSARRDNLRSHVRRMHKVENMYIDTFSPV